MVFSSREASNIFNRVKRNRIVEGSPINSFLGHLIAEGSNILNYKPLKSSESVMLML